MTIEGLEIIVEGLKSRLNLSEELCKELMIIQHAKHTNKSQSHQVITGGNFENFVGFIVMIKHDGKDSHDNTYSCAYAIHKLDAEVGRVREVLNYRPFRRWWFGLGSRWSYEKEKEKAKLFGGDVQDYVTTYLEFKAMEAFQKKGMTAINYED